MKRSIVYVFLFLFTILLSFEANAQREWQRLGSRKVNFGIERDVIHVGLKDGTFRKLRFVVSGGALNMRRVVVEYGNGTKDEIEVRHNFAKGSWTREIDLQGGNRVIRDITFWYDTKNRSNRRATLTVFGRK